MRVIGIDPGSNACGYAIVEEVGKSFRFIDSGEIRPKTSLRIHERLHQIREGISRKLEQFSPACMSIENVFVAKNSKSALLLGQARGAVLTVAGARGMEVYEYSSTMVKKSVSGNGRASKEEIQKIVSIILGKTEFKSPDESDAIAIALCHINNLKSQTAIAGFVPRKSARRKRFTLNDLPAERKNC